MQMDNVDDPVMTWFDFEAHKFDKILGKRRPNFIQTKPQTAAVWNNKSAGSQITPYAKTTTASMLNSVNYTPSKIKNEPAMKFVSNSS